MATKTMLLLLTQSLLLISHVTSSASTCDTAGLKTTTRPEKRVARAKMAVKALVTALYPAEEGAKAELWILDVYKGADKLAAAMGVLGGPEAVHHLRDK